MKAFETIPAILVTGALLYATACSESPGSAAKEPAACRAMAPADMTQTDYVCAHGAELQAIADTLATVTDRATANAALPILKKSRDRIKLVKRQRDRLNADQNMAGAKGAMAATKLKPMIAASRDVLNEAQRILKEHPELWRDIGPALDGAEIQ